MKTLEITARPLDAYFLGSERNAAHENSPTQLTQRQPYLIRSTKMLSQSAAFGALRYLGIRTPRADFRLEAEDRANIGGKSFELTGQNQEFGRIQNISPVVLTDEEGKRWIPAPRNRIALEKKQKGEGAFQPFTRFTRVETTQGTRCLPEEYDEKKAWDGAELLCLETGALRGGVFTTQLRTGINRQSQKKARSGEQPEPGTPSGFFKKEYVVLEEGFAFLFYAQVEDDFFCHEEGVVYMGQGRTPFAFRVKEAVGYDLTLPKVCMPQSVELNGEAGACRSAVALSDCYYPAALEQLKGMCSLMLAGSRDYRTFVTQYTAENSKKRYKKGEEGLKLIPAGSVFLFLGTQEETAREQMEAFRAEMERVSAQAKKAGFNCLCYTTDKE